jgi:hypothetical protein
VTYRKFRRLRRTSGLSARCAYAHGARVEKLERQKNILPHGKRNARKAVYN